jgi:hypothetical protein
VVQCTHFLSRACTTDRLACTHTAVVAFQRFELRYSPVIGRVHREYCLRALLGTRIVASLDRRARYQASHLLNQIVLNSGLIY